MSFIPNGIYYFHNASDEFAAQISLDANNPTTTREDIFSIVYTVEQGVTNTGPITCPAGGDVDVYVTVTLTGSPTENLTAGFNVGLTATSIVPTP